jgi:glycyl-tRNA synthetase
MAPPYVEAKLTLTYPIYAVDFDPRNNGSLIVGGGGGEGRSGVSNKIVRALPNLSYTSLMQFARL